MRVEGSVSAGFETVREMFEEMFRSGCEKQAQLCVYMGQERVVDLWGSVEDDHQFGPDSIVNIFSSTKTITAIVVAMLVSQGRLSYEGKVSDYWPEFAANGKGELTLADVLRHEGGLSRLDTTLNIEDLTAERIKQNAVGKIIEQQRLVYRGEGEAYRREYHGWTRGWILNEIVRRVDDRGRTIGEILRQEITDPLRIDAFIGLSDAEMPRVTPVENASMKFLIKQGFVPKCMGRKIDLNIFQQIWILKDLKSVAEKSSRPAEPPQLNLSSDEEIFARFNDVVMRKSECPSGNGHISARGMSALAAAMANGGSFNGVRLISEETWNSFHSDATEGDMLFCTNFFTKGGVEELRPDSKSSGIDGIEGCFGWYGFGGSVFEWHPETKIGFAFVPSFLYWIDILNLRGKKLLREVLRCARNSGECD